jgi:hypothetical protein
MSGSDREQEKRSEIAKAEQSLQNSGSGFEMAFDTLFNFLYDPSPDIRKLSSETLASHPRAREKLIRIYRDYYDSDVRKSILAGRVIGRKIAGGKLEIIRPEYAKIRFGLDIAFVPCSCGHCGRINAGIPVPGYGIYHGYYGQTDYRGVFFLPVLCDFCSKEFFIAWDEDPRNP